MSAAEFGDPRLPRHFWAKVHVDAESGCWLWTASRRKGGYGQVWLYGRLWTAHRASYAALVGNLPPHVPGGLELDHLCRVRACVNPAHLELVLTRENILRGSGPSANGASRTHCPRGHALEGDNLEPSQMRRGKRQCQTCHVVADAARHSAARVARRALGMARDDYRAIFGQGRFVAEHILAAIESGIAPEMIVANARTAHEAIRAENVDAWLDALRERASA